MEEINCLFILVDLFCPEAGCRERCDCIKWLKKKE
jgi:hypothetical protein